MPLSVVLNELSYQGWAPEPMSVRQMIAGLANIMKDVIARRPGSHLLSEVRLADLGFVNGEALRSYVRDGEVRDSLLFLFSAANRAPFSAAEVDIAAVEVKVEGASAVGAAYCFALSGLLASVPTREIWCERKLPCLLEQLAEDDENADLATSEILLPNVSGPADLAEHEGLLIEPPYVWTGGAELWAARLEAFPNIEFCPRVADDMQRLGTGTEQLRQVADRLAELQTALQSWDIITDACPNWLSLVTGEGETRKRLCLFAGSDGSQHCFDLHARYTPGAGRIHFRLLRELAKIEVAYIGEKL